jgi:hypothetical protein
MKLRRITRIRHGETSYRFVDADTGQFYRNSPHPYAFAVAGKLDDDEKLVPFSFHVKRIDALIRHDSIFGIDGLVLVIIEVEP